MSTIMEATAQDNPMQSGVAQFPPSAMGYNIKRIGGRPLRFEGSELAMAMSYSETMPYWYEINLYRTSDQRFVAAVRLFYQAEGKQDTVQAWEAMSLDDALDKLAAYDAAIDIPLSRDLDFQSTCAAEMAAQALNLQAQIADARQHYQGLVGEFLFDLENGQ